MTDPRCAIRKNTIRLKKRIGPETDIDRKRRILTDAQLMGIRVSQRSSGQGAKNA